VGGTDVITAAGGGGGADCNYPESCGGGGGGESPICSLEFVPFLTFFLIKGNFSNE
jgi:hypothetical protein